MQKKEKSEKIKKAVQRVVKKSGEKNKKVKDISKKIKQIVQKIKSGNSSDKQEDLRKIKKYKASLIDFSSESISKEAETELHDISGHDVSIHDIASNDISSVVSEVHSKIDALHASSVMTEDAGDNHVKANIESVDHNKVSSDVISAIVTAGAETVSEVVKEVSEKPENTEVSLNKDVPRHSVLPKVEETVLKTEVVNHKIDEIKSYNKFSEFSNTLKSGTTVKVKGDLNNTRKIKIDRAALEKIRSNKTK